MTYTCNSIFINVLSHSSYDQIVIKLFFTVYFILRTFLFSSRDSNENPRSGFCYDLYFSRYDISEYNWMYSSCQAEFARK